jgi:hypothetical protein
MLPILRRFVASGGFSVVFGIFSLGRKRMTGCLSSFNLRSARPLTGNTRTCCYHRASSGALQAGLNRNTIQASPE